MLLEDSSGINRILLELDFVSFCDSYGYHCPSSILDSDGYQIATMNKYCKVIETDAELNSPCDIQPHI